MDEMDYYEYEESKKITPFKVLKTVFKWSCYLVIVATFVMLIGRIQMAKIPKKFKEFTWTEAAKEAAKDGEIELILQEPYSSFDDNGYYHLSATALSPESGEVQCTVRYNSRSTINALMQWYGLTDRPQGETFVYILSDQDGNTYTDYQFAAASRPLYEFRRLVFDGVKLENVTTLYLDVYYGDDVSNDGRMNASFVIYDSEMNAMKPESPEIKDSSLTFRDAPAYINRLTEDEE